MKKVFVFISLALLLKPVLPVLDYAWNYDFIIKELCENKDKPEMECNGKCHLMKELAKASEAEKPISSDKKELHKEIELLFYSDIQSILPNTPLFLEKNSCLTPYSNLYKHLEDRATFHPPTVLS